jgi:hypothetical protein
MRDGAIESVQAFQNSGSQFDARDAHLPRIGNFCEIPGERFAMADALSSGSNRRGRA